MQNKNVTIFDHVLVNHKIAILRNVETGTKHFREIIEEIATLLAFEALKDLPTTQVEVQTPLEKTMQTMVQENSLAIIPILRAGLGMVNGVLALFPTAKVGHIGLYRDEETFEPKEYYCKLPVGIEDKVAILLDPMLATGGSASAAVQFLKNRGVTKIKLMSILAAPEGIARLTKDHPDIQVYVAKCDRCLNDRCYILPGLGDAGDRLFGTK